YISGGAERIKVLFTPTVCKVRCTQGRCTNFCEQGNVTALYISEQGDRAALGPGFRVFLCPMLCQNGGVCIQKDRCLCPPTFTGKFCHIPVATPSTNDIEKPPRSPSVLASQQLLSQSEYILPLQSQQQSHTSGSSMVKVRVQHPPEASVKIHQVLKVGYGPGTVRERSETVTWSAGLSGASTSVLPGERAAATPPKPRVQAQTLHGNSTNTESSVFKYCFREVRNGQCISPLPGLRSQDTCCRGIGLAWGINECVLCPPNTGNGVDGSCPAGFERINGTQCVDVNECLQPGFCENGNCVNTRGSYSCVCRQGYILDASHGICISHRVISEDKDQCYRILNSGSGRGSCSVPILRDITKQICCCSRVGKAWGENCERCPYFGSVAFKEICPAGPGYHYSASVIQFNQRLLEQHGTGGPPVISQSTGQTRPQQPASSGAQTPQTSHQQPGITTLLTTPTRPQQPGGGSLTLQTRPQQPSVEQWSSGGSLSSQGRPHIPASSVTAGPTQVVTARPLTQTQWPPVDRRPVSPVRPAQPLPPLVTPRPPIPRPVRGVCETMPQVCGQGRCVNQPGGRHTCICNEGYQLNAQQIRCQDIDECRASPPPCGSGRCQNTEGGYRCSCPSGYQPGPRGTSCKDIDECRQVPNPCNNGRCENSPGSFKCVCRTGYTLEGNACKDVDECEDPLRCPVQACANSPGSYKCVSCPPGFGLLNEQCSDVDECHQTPSLCTNGRCENTPGSYRCVCHTGYKLQGKTCTDVDECEDPLRCPGQACVNSQGSYNCVSCKPGFSMINGHCSGKIPLPLCVLRYTLHPFRVYLKLATTFFSNLLSIPTDIDECRQTPSPCTTGHCENTQGSYSCACLTGYRLHGDTCTDVDECADPSQCPGQECVNSLGSYKCVSCKPGFVPVDRHCTDVDECLHSPTPCANGRCENTAGSYKCACRSGFRLQGDTCGDVDECQSPDTCGAARLCVNTDGSYRCDCQPGYRTAGPGRQCRDVNECLEGEYCFPRGECVNTEGSYRCVCSQGYTTSSDGGSCLDVDECARSGPGACQDGRCVNTEGSYQCQCQVGFTTNPEKTACLDVDECSEGAVCRSQRCENTVGSYRCITSCEPGYRVTRTGECVDINECANETVCGEHAFCQNLIGTYQCMCDQGYTATSDGKGCVDENECETMQGVCGAARCENVDGSFMCECPGEGEEFDTRSGQCLSTPRPGTIRCPTLFTGEQSSCSVLARNTTQQECCCTVGQGWGMGCQYDPCPPLGTAEHQALCPSGRGYVTGPGAFSYKDVDECKLFHPEVCKSGVCVNNIPGYSCYCTIGYYYDDVFLECIDVDECEAGEDSCPGGICVNILGSHVCTCEPPLVLDDTQRSCVNSTDLAVDENLSFCWQFVTADLVCQSPLLGGQVTFTECCCLYGEGWGLHCALCPARDSGPGPGRGGEGEGGVGYRVPYGPDSFPDPIPRRPEYPQPDYDDYTPAGGSSPERYYDEDDYGPPDAPPRPHLRTLPDPRSDDPYSEEEEGPEPWRVGPPFPPFPDRQGPGGGGGPRRVYERRYEPYAGLSTEDCGILHGCENGRCIRVAEGYTCDCYEGYELDMTSMACIDINECVNPDNACANGRCIDTDGSYRCVCHRGYVMSRRPNHCVAA
uniref:Latent-transforming growth factor beta-binding protein 1 n=1 Tax=Oncorhynchus mykiss TaxID=8022 RepID=A0A8C7RI37_ONCMY